MKYMPHLQNFSTCLHLSSSVRITSSLHSNLSGIHWKGICIIYFPSGAGPPILPTKNSCTRGTQYASCKKNSWFLDCRKGTSNLSRKKHLSCQLLLFLRILLIPIDPGQKLKEVMWHSNRITLRHGFVYLHLSGFQIFTSSLLYSSYL